VNDDDDDRPWHGHYRLACEGLALLVCRRDNHTVPDYRPRALPESAGLRVGGECLVRFHAGEPPEYSVVRNPTLLRLVEVEW